MDPTRTCKICERGFPATEEFFLFRKSSKNGKSYPSSYCRPCERAKASKSRRDTYATPDGKARIDAQTAAYRAKPEKRELISRHLKWRYRTDEAYREERKVNSSRYRKRHPEWKRRISAAWHQRTKHRTRRKRALFETFFPDLKLRSLVRRAVCEGMKLAGGSKAGRSVLRHLPYSMAELRNHLESLWEPWMSWSNYGPWERDRRTWQIDHAVPQAALPYDDFGHPNFLRCWALPNLRPLEAVRNLSEGARGLL